MTDPTYYATYDDDACVIFRDLGKAWVFFNTWKPLHLAEAMNVAKVLSKEEFKRMFPDLPPLPSPADEPP